MSRAKDVFDGLEMEGISRILEKQKALESTTSKQRDAPSKPPATTQPVRLGDYIRRNSEKRQNSRQSVRKFIGSMGNGNSPGFRKKTSYNREELHQTRLTELRDYVRRHIVNDQSYKEFEQLLEAVESSARQAYQSASESSIQDTHPSSIQYQAISPVLRPKYQDGNFNDETLSPKIAKKRAVQFSQLAASKQQKQMHNSLQEYSNYGMP